MDENRLSDTRKLWDEVAATFDNEPDHGLRDPITRAAWKALLDQYLPSNPSKILDMGCGTGSLSLIFAELGHHVIGADLSPEMLAIAENKMKVAGYSAAFHVTDAAFPDFPTHQFDVIVCRHLLWTLPEPAEVLQRWISLLKPDGHLLLIEGSWETGAGIPSSELVKMLPAAMTGIKIKNLSGEADQDLWGKIVSDERYLIRAHLKEND